MSAAIVTLAQGKRTYKEPRHTVADDFEWPLRAMLANGRELTFQLGQLSSTSKCQVFTHCILAMVFLVLTACGGGDNAAPSVPKTQMAVPNVKGMTQTAATSAITSAGLVVGTVTKQSSSTTASGGVISESPAAGSTVTSGSAVNLVISTGVAKVTVPNVLGLTPTAATTAIISTALVVGSVTTQSSSTIAAGLVISESPVAGTTVTSNSTVALIVSSGLPQVIVPNVVGLTQVAATKTIISVGLIVGTVTTQFSSKVAAGLVINESPIAGTSVTTGSVVSLVIAKPTPTLTSISVAPGSVSLLLNSPLQLWATAAYSDGSLQDVTGAVTWGSSAPGVATVSSTGLLKGISAGGAKITATLGAAEGSASVTIGSSATGFTMVEDATDSRLFTYTNSDGSVDTFLGTRDSSGLPVAINQVLINFPDASTETIELDAAQRPSVIRLSTGGEFTLNWNASGGAIVTAISPDGTTELSAVTTASSSSASQAVSAAKRLIKNVTATATRNSQNQSSSGGSGGGQQATVNVQTCGVPENQASVTFTQIRAYGGQPITATPQGGGSYSVNFPSGPGSLNLGGLDSASASSYGQFCSSLSAVTTSVNVMCAALTVAADIATEGIALPESAAIFEACTASVAGVDALKASCAANTGANVIQNTNAFVNYLNSLSSNIQAIATVQGFQAPVAETLTNVAPQGPYIFPEPINMGCPAVSSVDVTPSDLTLDEGDSAILTAVINGPTGVIQSSGYMPSWTSSSDTEASVVPNSPPTATVTAGNIPTGDGGAPTEITATSNGASGTARVTITGPVEYIADFTLSGTVNASNGNGNCIYADSQAIHLVIDITPGQTPVVSLTSTINDVPTTGTFCTSNTTAYVEASGAISLAGGVVSDTNDDVQWTVNAAVSGNVISGTLTYNEIYAPGGSNNTFNVMGPFTAVIQ